MSMFLFTYLNFPPPNSRHTTLFTFRFQNIWRQSLFLSWFSSFCENCLSFYEIFLSKHTICLTWVHVWSANKKEDWAKELRAGPVGPKDDNYSNQRCREERRSCWWRLGPRGELLRLKMLALFPLWKHKMAVLARSSVLYGLPEKRTTETKTHKI